MIITLFSFLSRFKIANGGIPFDPPKVEAPKKEVAAPAPKGPSKKCEKKLPETANIEMHNICSLFILSIFFNGIDISYCDDY